MHRRLKNASLAVLATLAIPFAASAAEDSCGAGPIATAQRNAATLGKLPAAPFHRPEQGWAFYVPLVTNEIGVHCGAATPAFARALAAWQAKHDIAATGTMNDRTLNAFKQVWQARRPFISKGRGGCPATPSRQQLATVPAAQSYGGKTIEVEAQALAAYEKMADAARKAGLLASGSHLFSIFSGYRSPGYDAARCARQHNCQGIVRAACSAHRTGRAMDINLGAAAGFTPDSSADKNRLYMSQTPLYRWLVKNAARYGFVNYAFEPWHWEFAGGALS